MLFSGGRSTDHGTDLACSPSTRICTSFIAKVLEAAPGSAGIAPVDVVVSSPDHPYKRTSFRHVFEGDAS